jgi:type II secretory pathway pseudopilin PulG
MTCTKTKTVVLTVAVILVGIVTILWLNRKHAARAEKLQQSKIAATVNQINERNAGLPDPQIQAKTLVMTAMIQKKIPAAANWCDTLNAGNTLWPVTPTNTVFAVNSRMAGRAYTRGIRGDTVVFFETSNPGWNQAGGPELLAKKNEGVAVAFADGRALIVSSDDAAKLRWEP